MYMYTELQVHCTTYTEHNDVTCTCTYTCIYTRKYNMLNKLKTILTNMKFLN